MKFFSDLELQKLCELKGALLERVAGYPTTPVEGQIGYNTTTAAFGVYNPNAWLNVYSYNGTGLSYGGRTSDYTYSATDTSKWLPYLQRTGDVVNSQSADAMDDSHRNKLTIINIPVSAITDHTITPVKLAAFTYADRVMITDNNSYASSSADIGITSNDLDLGKNGTKRKIVNLADPINDYDAVNKRYINNMSVGLNDFKDSCYVSTIAHISNFSNVQVSTALDGGITAANGQRVLVKSQNVGSKQYNGIYVISNLSGGYCTLSRTADANVTGSLSDGTFVWVDNGTTYGGSAWIVSGSGTPTLDTDPVLWVLFSSSSISLTAGDGINISGNTISVKYDDTTISVNGSSQLCIDTAYPGQTSIVTLGAVTTGSWHATAVEVDHGGTGLTVVEAGSLLYGAGTGVKTLNKLVAGSAGQILTSGPAWTTATYPATTTINQLLYSSAANTVTGLATANSSVLVTSSGGVPSLSTNLPAGITLGTYTIYTSNSTIPVANGGTGNSTAIAYSLICGGTTTTGAFQSVSSVASGSALISNGTGALPTWGKITLGTHTSGSYVASISGTASEVEVSGTTTVTVGLPDAVSLTTSLTAPTVNASTVLQTAGVSRIDNAGNMPNTGDVTFGTGKTLQTGTTAGNTFSLSAKTTPSGAYVPFITLTANATPTCDLASGVTIGSSYIYRASGTDVPIADGGTGTSSFTDNNAVVIYTSTGPKLITVANGAAGTFLKSGGTGTAPSWSTITLGTDVIGSYVASLNGTTNQIVCNNSTGIVTLSFPNDLRAPDTFNATTSIATGATAGTVRIDSSGNLKNILTVNPAQAAGSTLKIQARDTDGGGGSGSDTAFITLTSNTTPTCDLDTSVTINNKFIQRVGTVINVADGGTGCNTLAAGSILIGAGTSAISSFSVSGNNGQYLTTTGTALQWSSVSLPTSATANTLIWAGTSNTITSLATTTASVMCSPSGVPTWTTTLPTSLTIPSPKITTGIFDTNNKAIIALTATASATNYLTVANAANGGSPVITVTTTSDTNQSLIFEPKDSGGTTSSWGRLLWKDGASTSPSLSLVRRWAFTLDTTTSMRNGTAITIGTSIAITHNFGTSQVAVFIFDSSGAQVYTDVTTTSTDVVTLTFKTAPPTGGSAYQVLIIG